MLDASTITLLFAGTSLAGAALSVALALKWSVTADALGEADAEHDRLQEENDQLKADNAQLNEALSAQELEIRKQGRDIAAYRLADQKRADQRIAASHARVAKLAAAKANGARV